MRNKLDNVFNFVENHIASNVKLLLGVAAVAAVFFTAHTLLKEPDITEGSVMITNFSERSGGTGVILDSKGSLTRILTNSHVCKVIEKGGLVITQKSKFMVQTYKHSEVHDICLITVTGNLNHTTKVASSSPEFFKDKALISGHPALLPNVVTSGHVSGQKIIQVMMGFKPCSEDDMKDPMKGLLCLLAGGIPIVRQFESTLVTATIMPGSSGSAVYNEKKELVGLVFAGRGELGYAWTVPFEYIQRFLKEEEKILDATPVPTEFSPTEGLTAKTNLEMFKALREACRGTERSKIINYCNLVEQDLIWVE